MKHVVDVVNFNADASCLPAARWLEALDGGEASAMCRWLAGFVQHDRKVTLGIVGASVVDMSAFNPQAIALINAHPNIFEIIWRPFSHDIALLRGGDAFKLNVTLGRRVLEREFEHMTQYFLPPEFMLTNEQVSQLAELGAEGAFINASRFKPEVEQRIPRQPYLLAGLFGSTLRCVPVDGALTDAYLETLHEWDGSVWNAAVMRSEQQTVCSWRDGESWLFVPDGVDREHAWLRDESDEYSRVFVSELVSDTVFLDARADVNVWKSYPVHSFAEWVREFRMFGYLRRLKELELRLEELTLPEQIIWLQAANSDVLSAVEKDAPTVSIKTQPLGHADREDVDWTILRSERGFEGEECLAILERYATTAAREYLMTSDDPHMVKLRARIAYFDG